MDIKSLDFKLMSLADMEALSVYEVTNHKQGPNCDTTGTVFDIRSGAQGTRSCGTCGQGAYDCPGHFGIIRLMKPIIHPLMLQQTRDLMRIICYECHKPCINKHITGNGPRRIHEMLRIVNKRGMTCVHCGAPTSKYKLSSMPSTKTSKAKKKIHRVLCRTVGTSKTWLTDEDVANVLDDVPDDMVKSVLGTVHPSCLVLRAWLAIPPVCRHLENGRGDGHQRHDDLTGSLCDIVRLNNIAKDASLPQKDRDAAYLEVKTKISVYCTNTAKIKRNDNGDMVRGIIDRMKGKQGLIRNNLLGKRSD